MSARKRPGGPGMEPPYGPPKRSKFGSPRGRPPPFFDRPPRGPRFSPGGDDFDFPPPPPYPFDDFFPPPPFMDDEFGPPPPLRGCPPPPRSHHRRHHHERHHSRRSHDAPQSEVPGSPSMDEVLFMDMDMGEESPHPRPPPAPPVSDHHTEFNYLYKYGHLERQEKGQRLSSVSSGYASDNAPPPGSAARGGQSNRRPRGTVSTRGRGSQRGGQSGGFLGGKGSEDKWSVAEDQSSPSGRGRGTFRGQGSTRGQFVARGHGSDSGRGRGGVQVMKHKPLPPAKPSNALHMTNMQQGVHSMAAVAKPDIVNMSEPEKLFRFMTYLRNETPRVNDIQTVENAITGCHLTMKTVYESDEVGNYSGRRVFTGFLRLNNFFLARAVGQTKKELKHECYRLALEVLRTKNVAQIMQQKDVGIEAIRKTFEECNAKKDEQREEGELDDTSAKLAEAAPITVAAETVATPEERWAEFIKFVKANASQTFNPISRIEMAMSGSRCGLDRTYTDCALNTVKPMFEGSLVIGGVLQAQAVGMKKKEAKQKTYELTLERLTTLELSQILQGVAPREYIADTTDRAEERLPKGVTVKEIRTPEQIKRLEIFIDRIKDSSMREGPITLMDMTASQLQLLITCVYRRVKSEGLTYTCLMYIGDILISEGEGKQRKETQMDAYLKAYERLISTPLETIMVESCRLDKAELEAPDIDELVVKGQIRQVESNLSRLKKQHPTNLTEAMSEKKSLGLVIVEHEDWVHDRKKHAFCILQNSALMNVMLMEWNIDAMTGFFNCKVSIQGEELGSARASSKQIARNLAAADILFRMYETHPVLRIMATEDTGNWVTRAVMLEKLKQMSESELAEALAREPEAQTPQKVNRKMKPKDMKKDEDGEDGDREKEEKMLGLKLKIVALKMIDEFAERGDVLDELVFSPELPTWIRRLLPMKVAEMGLRTYQRQKEGRFYMAIATKTRVDKIVEAMLERGVKKTNKFLLIDDRSELPCHSDIVADIEVARQMPRKLEQAGPRGMIPNPSLQRLRGYDGNGSLNGSLFEETVDGFVTAQSSFLEGSSSATPLTSGPAVQSTPVKDLKKVYGKLSDSLMSSPVGQTPVAKVDSGSSTPVVNPVVHAATSTVSTSSSVQTGVKQSAAPSQNVAQGASKNILVSPPAPDVGSVAVTIAAPKQTLSVSSIPLPQISTPTAGKSAVTALKTPATNSAKTSGSDAKSFPSNTSNVSFKINAATRPIPMSQQKLTHQKAMPQPKPTTSHSVSAAGTSYQPKPVSATFGQQGTGNINPTVHATVGTASSTGGSLYKGVNAGSQNQYFSGAVVGSQGQSAGLGSQGPRAGISQGPSGEFGSVGQTVAFGSQGYSAAFGSQGPSAGFGNQVQSAVFGNQVQSVGFGNQGQGAGFGNQGQSAGFGNQVQSAGVGSQGQSTGVGSEGQNAGVGSQGQSAGNYSAPYPMDVAADGSYYSYPEQYQSSDYWQEGGWTSASPATDYSSYQTEPPASYQTSASVSYQTAAPASYQTSAPPVAYQTSAPQSYQTTIAPQSYQTTTPASYQSTAPVSYQTGGSFAQYQAPSGQPAPYVSDQGVYPNASVYVENETSAQPNMKWKNQFR